MANEFDTALVIGIHREELDFGKQVARMVAGEGIRIVQIDNGLSHKRSHYRSGFYHSTAHREMYLQLHQQFIGNKVDLVIDLHTGINDTGRCADVLSADTSFLKQMGFLFEGVQEHTFSEPGAERLYEIIPLDERSRPESGVYSVCHTIIPPKVWDAPGYIYAGLEIYLQEIGKGSLSDLEYATEIIRMLKSAAEQKIHS